MEAVLFLLPALSLVTSFGVSLAELALLLAGAAAAPALLRARPRWAVPVRPITLALLLNAAVAVASLALTGFDSSYLENPLRMLPAIFTVGLVVLARPRPEPLWFGIFAGAIGAALLGLWQRIGLGMPRAEGFHMTIMFGDIAMALGLMSLAAIDRFAGTRWAAAPYVAFLAGVLASVLSVSRGGWIALAMSFVPLYSYGGAQVRRRIVAVVVATVALFALGFALPQTGVRDRVLEAGRDVSLYFGGGELFTPVGTRLEMWRAAGKMFLAHPVAGVGRANFQDAKEDLIRRGEISPKVAEFRHAHNEIVNALATGGLVGTAALVLLYAAPFAFFLRRLRRGRDGAPDAARPLALAGLLLVLSFIDFGLTQVMFAHHIGAAFYAFMVALLAGLCVRLDEGTA